MVKRPLFWVNVASSCLGVQEKCWSHKGSTFPSHLHQAPITSSVKEVSGSQIPFHMSVWSTTLSHLVQHFPFLFKGLHHFIVLACVVSTQQEQSMPMTNTFSFLQRFHINNLQCMALLRLGKHVKAVPYSLKAFQQIGMLSFQVWNGCWVNLLFFVFQNNPRIKGDSVQSQINQTVKVNH